MAKAAVFIADGSEEVEAITPIDILRRAKVEVDIVSVMPGLEIITSKGIRIIAEKHISDIVFDEYDMLVLPGGRVGTKNFKACDILNKHIVEFYEQGKCIAALCAAPTVFSSLGLLDGKESTCNPDFWEELLNDGADLLKDNKVVINGNVITSQAMGTSVDFGLALVAYLCGEEEAEELRKIIRFGAI